VSAPGCGGALAPVDLVGEDHQQELLEGEVLLLGQEHALGERVHEPAEAQSLEGALELGADRL